MSVQNYSSTFCSRKLIKPNKVLEEPNIEQTLIDEKIKSWLKKNEPDEWETAYKIYKEEMPRPRGWNKLNKNRAPLPSEYKPDKIQIIGSKKNRKYYETCFEFNEVNGELTIEYFRKALTVDRWLDQKWIEKEKNKWIHKDQDLSIRRNKYTLDLHLPEKKKIKSAINNINSFSPQKELKPWLTQLIETITLIFQKIITAIKTILKINDPSLVIKASDSAQETQLKIEVEIPVFHMQEDISEADLEVDLDF